LWWFIITIAGHHHNQSIGERPFRRQSLIIIIINNNITLANPINVTKIPSWAWLGLMEASLMGRTVSAISCSCPV
jgi:hypothetical protein